MKNSIFVIHPYIWNGTWVFDDEDKGLVKEPFVMNADIFLSLISEGDECTVIFSDKDFPGSQYDIERINEEENYSGTWYYSKLFNMKLWLCGALNLFFSTSPENIYLQIK
jgi:hypothetical protein